MSARFNVRALRQSMGMTTEELADKIGVHARTIERWESGGVAPSPLAISKLRELQHPEVPRRRNYEGQTDSEQQQQTTAAVTTPPMGGGITPSRRMVSHDQTR